MPIDYFLSSTPMRKLIIFIFILLFCFIAVNARQLDATEAYKRAMNDTFWKKSNISQQNISPIYIASEGTQTHFYVFANPKSTGFVIVSADDSIIPILGYSEDCDFDIDNIPDNLKYWIAVYQQQIKEAIQKGLVCNKILNQNRTSIEPLIKAKWSQGYPFFNMCPTKNGMQTYTGCIATAMAQLMYYHKWPERGNSSHFYLWGNGQTLSLDFSSITYQWNKMMNVYTDAASEENKNAVAELMYSCGVSVEMNYGTSGSSADHNLIANALTDYFGYDVGMLQLNRDYYLQSEWENIIYEELQCGRPVLYRGSTYNNEGHEFVCDGYENGYFHINWGWGGSCDGYFVLTALNPPSDDNHFELEGFNFEQAIVIGIKPNSADSKAKPYMYTNGNFSTKKTKYSLGDIVQFTTSLFPFSCAFYNGGIRDLDYLYGIKITDSAGNISYRPEKEMSEDEKYEFNSLSPGQGLSSFKINLKDLLPGEYIVTPAFISSDNNWHDIRVKTQNVKEIAMTVTDSDISFNQIKYNPNIQASNVILHTPISLNTDFTISAILTAETECTTPIRVNLYDKGANTAHIWSETMLVTLYPGQSLEWQQTLSFPYYNQLIGYPTEGDYELVLADASNHQFCDRIPVFVSLNSENSYDPENPEIVVEPEEGNCDVNGDGIFNIQDIHLTLSYILNNNIDIITDGADTNQDGQINATDAVNMIDILFRLK